MLRRLTESAISESFDEKCEGFDVARVGTGDASDDYDRIQVVSDVYQEESRGKEDSRESTVIEIAANLKVSLA
jgi:hypothetical protein